MLKKTIVCLVAILVLVILAACSQEDLTGTGIDSLIQDGIILDPDTVLPPTQLNLTQAVREDFYQHASFPVSFLFPHSHHLSFERERMGLNNAFIRTILYEHGHFSGISDDLLRQGFINEGDFIAELTIDPPQAILIDILELEMERDLFEATFATERQNRLQEIASIRTALETAPEGEGELIALLLELAELRLQQFLNNAAGTRANLDNRMEVLRAPIDTERMYAPISGHSTVWLQNLDRPGLFRNLPTSPPWMTAGEAAARTIFIILDRSTVYLFAEAPLHALRYGDTVPVVHSGTDAYFYAMVATDPMTLGIWREGNHPVGLIPLEGELERFFEEIGVDTDNWTLLSWGLTGLLAQPTIPLITDGVLVDARAVVTENLRHYVTIYNNGHLSKRYVTLGLRTGFGLGSQIQILSGLEAGQWVVIP